MLALLLIGNVYALEFDNVKEYNAEKKEVTIKNSFGLGEDIAKIKLNTPLNNYVPRGYRKVAEFEINSYKDYNEFIKGLKLYDLKNNWNEINRDFDIKYKKLRNISVNDYEEVCFITENNKNNSKIKECSKILSGNHKEEITEWVKMNTFNINNNEKITIGIFTEVKKGDYIEWIPKLFGLNIEEWATWEESINADIEAYWTMNETSGNTNLDNVNGKYNITHSGTQTSSGKIAYGTSYSNQNGTFANPLTLGTKNFTICSWAKFTTMARLDPEGIIGTANDFQFAIGSSYAEAENISVFAGDGSSWSAVNDMKTPANIGDWYFICVTRNDTNITLYVNGTPKRSALLTGSYTDIPGTLKIAQGVNSVNNGRAMNGIIDEMGFWYRALSISEISDLYNGGTGLTYNATNFPNITLNSPEDNYLTTSPEIFFNWTAESPETIKNTTLYINNILNTSINYNIDNKTTETLSLNFSIGEYNWSIEACKSNNICSFSENRSFEISSFVVNSVNYTTPVLEGDSQNFSINFSLDDYSKYINIVSKLNYNGTNYTSTTSDSGNTRIYTSNLNIPILSGTSSQNRSFYWIVELSNGTSINTQTSSEYNQTVDPIILAECSGTYSVVAINFTAYREDNLTRINPFSFNGFFEYTIGYSQSFKNLTISNSSTDEIILCLSPNYSSFNIYADIDYGSDEVNDSYVNRKYYFYNHTINNQTQNISLYLLDSTDSTTFIQEVEDQQTDEVPNAYIYTQRWYPGEGIYRTVQITKTDDNGKTVGFYKTETVDYKHTIYYLGENVLETNRGKIFPESSPYTLIFRIGESLIYPWEDVDDVDGIESNLTYSNSTNIVTFQWISDSSVTGNLLVYQEMFNETANLLCNSSQTISVGSLTCDLSSYGNGTFIAYGYIDNTLTDSIQFLISSIISIFGNTGILLGFFIILTASLAFIWNPTAMVVVHNVATIFVTLIGLIAFSPIYIFSMISISTLLIIWLKT